MEVANSKQQFGSDQLWEIFSRMPAKAVFKFLSLSKSLSNLVSEPLFAERQSVHSSVLDCGFFLQLENQHTNKLEFHVLPGNHPSAFGVPDVFFSFLAQNGRVLTMSSQGLLLIFKTDNSGDYISDKSGRTTFLICNPATRNWAAIPLPNWIDHQHYVISGLYLECHPTKLQTSIQGFCSDYTIVMPIRPDRLGNPASCFLAVYRNGKWEEDICDLRIRDRQLRTHMPVGLYKGDNGSLVIHYICDSLMVCCGGLMFTEPYVVGFDIQKKVFSSRFSLPVGAWKKKDASNRLFTLNMFKWKPSETLGLVRIDNIGGGCTLTVWVLEDYFNGVWRMVAKKMTTGMGLPYGEARVVCCCVANGSNLVFSTSKRVYVYTMEGVDAGRVKLLSDYDCELPTRVTFTLYANTLRPVCGAESDIHSF